ncbi:hypothetical protein [Methylocella sp.]|uniref:hypothetical protein n=1 Tax=Methylocella sp. TaxID=1978226 RepID=UPI00378518A7
MAGCGYTPAQIDEMTLHDVAGLYAYWRDCPPTHEILKCVHGVERKPPPAAVNGDDPSGVGGLIARWPDGHVRAGGGPGG